MDFNRFMAFHVPFVGLSDSPRPQQRSPESQPRSGEGSGLHTNDSKLFAVRTGRRSSSRRSRVCVWGIPQDSAGDWDCVSGKSATENQKKIDIKKLHEMSK